VQGTRDKLADLTLLQSVTKKLGRRVRLHLIDQADHAFHVPVRSGRNDSDVVTDILGAFSRWIDRIVPHGASSPGRVPPLG